MRLAGGGADRRPIGRRRTDESLGLLRGATIEQPRVSVMERRAVYPSSASAPRSPGLLGGRSRARTTRRGQLRSAPVGRLAKKRCRVLAARCGAGTGMPLPIIDFAPFQLDLRAGQLCRDWVPVVARAALTSGLVRESGTHGVGCLNERHGHPEASAARRMCGERTGTSSACRASDRSSGSGCRSDGTTSAMPSSSGMAKARFAPVASDR
jgi:hypothetical protein